MPRPFLPLLLALLVPAAALAQDGAGAPPDEETPERGETIDGEVVDTVDGVKIIAVESPIEDLEAPCAEGDGPKCFEAGQLWYSGAIPGVDKPNHPRAVNLFQAACAFGVVDGCLAAARMYLRMEAGMQLMAPDMTPSADLGAAAENLRFACEAGRRDACGLMGDLYVNPAAKAPEGAQFRNIEQDYFYAAQAYQDGCNAAAFLDPRDVRPDGTVDARSCARLGELHELGAGVQLSPKFAAEYYERACRAGLTTICEKADSIKAALADGTYVSPGDQGRADREDPGPRGSGHLGRLNPDTERFKDDTTGIEDRKKEAGVRLDLVGMLGSRWFYGPPRTLGGVKWKAGLTIWVKLIGFSLETGFNTDRLFLVDERYYARYAHAFVIKGTFPLPIKLPIPAVVGLGVGAGPMLGHMRYQTTKFFLAYGAREHIQLWISTSQRRGPRQWGAIRFEQQQAWLTLDQRLEHSSQILFLFGFTFGGVAPEYPRGGGRVKEPITGRDDPRPNWD
jgi:hypothetical protein